MFQTVGKSRQLAGDTAIGRLARRLKAKFAMVITRPAIKVFLTSFSMRESRPIVSIKLS